MAKRREKDSKAEKYPKDLYAAWDGEGDERCFITAETPSDLIVMHETAHLARYRYVGLVVASNTTTVKEIPKGRAVP